jgi:hypothetical protein
MTEQYDEKLAFYEIQTKMYDEMIDLHGELG